MEPEKPELFGYYFQIPIKAEVKKVQLSMLSSLVQEKIRQLGGRAKASFVVVVSPITIQKLPERHSPVTMSDQSQSSNGRSMGKADKPTKKDLRTYLVPVKCSKNIALTILKLAQTSKRNKSSYESESSNFSNSLVPNHNLQMIEMKAATLYIYKNIMYLLPKSQEANTSDEKSEVEQSEAAESQARAKLRGKRKYKHNSLGCVTLRNVSFLQQQDRRIASSVSEKSVTVVKSCNEERCDLSADMKSTDAGPSSGSSTVKSLQMSFWEQSERGIKRKLPYLSNEEPFIKKTHQRDSDAKQDSTVAKNVLVRSLLQPHSSSSDAPSFSSERTSPRGYDSDATQDSTVAKNVLTDYSLRPNSSSLDAPSPIILQESPASFSHEETSPCRYLSGSDATQDSTVAKNVLTDYPFRPNTSSSDAPSPIIQESSASFSHEETSPCGYLSGSDATQDSTVAKNVLAHSLLQPNTSSSDAPSPLSPQELPAAFSHEETSPCGYLSDSDAKQDSTVAKNVLAHSLLQPNSSSSDAPSRIILQESSASFSHEETSPCRYLSDSDATQDSTVAKNVLTDYSLQPNSSSLDAPSPIILQESSASFSHEETSPCGYLSDSGAKQDKTVAKNVLTDYPLQPNSSSSYAPSPLSPQESPPSFSPEKTSPTRKTTDLERLSSSSSSSSLLCNIPQHEAPTPSGYDPTCADNMSPPHLKAKSSLSWSELTIGSEKSNDPDETLSASEPSQMFNHLRSEQPLFFLDIDDTTRDERRQRLLDRVSELKKKVEEMQQKSN